MASIVVNGDTSGAVTLSAPAVAGTVTVTLPAASGTMASLASVTANGVAYVNSSGQPTSGSALVFNGSNFALGVSPSTNSANTSIEINKAGNGLSVFSNTDFRMSRNVYDDGAKYARSSETAVTYRLGNGTFEWYNAPAGTAGNAITFTQAMTLTSGGVFLVRATSVNGSHVNANLLRSAETTDGSGVLIIESSNATNGTTAFFGVAGAGVAYNASACAFGIYRCSTNSRSINAAGSINASGADYAEYMTKAGDFAIAKGDVVGIDAQGRLTNVFANAISFAVKSTDPAYVGGDVWGSEEAIGETKPEKPSQRQSTEEVEAETDEEFAVRFAQYEADQSAFDAALEAARQRVDRIAFAGQVPVNVMGATAGQYIIPVSDNGAIKGEAVSNPTFEQYQIAVGKVIAIESDGRAKIIVKVA